MSPKAPFIVGAPRSGTTLLRLMLDAHSQMAIPPETGFIPAVLAAAGRPGDERRAFWQTLVEAETWPDFHLSPDALWQAIAALPSFSVSDGLRCFYRLYASRFGKALWGDKTPTYAFHLTAIRELLPESCFIHLIRDGRDVALSVAGLWFSPGAAVEDRARSWREYVETARRQAPSGNGYVEVRYEDLVRDPRPVLERVCDRLGLAFEEQMTAYHTRSPERLREHEGRYHADGSLRFSKAQRLEQQRRTQLPPDPSRAGRWRREMSEDERRRFEDTAGETLRCLGYETLGAERTAARAATAPLPEGRPALLVAHPGHELRLYGWMEMRAPVVFVLTDGSGKSQLSRLPSTTRVLDRCGAAPGSIYGRFTDEELYSIIREGDVAALRRVAEELAEELMVLQPSMVVGDAIEGYNPSHDLCQYLLRTAVRLVRERTGLSIETFEFPVVAAPPAEPDGGDEGSVLLRLDEGAVDRKLAAARDYPELRDEVTAAVDREGRGSLAVECLRRSDGEHAEARLSREVPFYETYGEKQVAAGHYHEVIRYKQHFEPLVRSLLGLRG